VAKDEYERRFQHQASSILAARVRETANDEELSSLRKRLQNVQEEMERNREIAHDKERRLQEVTAHSEARMAEKDAQNQELQRQLADQARLRQEVARNREEKRKRDASRAQHLQSELTEMSRNAQQQEVDGEEQRKKMAQQLADMHQHHVEELEQVKAEYEEHHVEELERYDECVQAQAQAHHDEHQRIVEKLQNEVAAKDAELYRLRGSVPQATQRLAWSRGGPAIFD